MTDSENIKNIELTQGQQALWTGQKLDPDSSLRNVVYIFEIDGALNTKVFKKAFQVVTEEVEALRTIFLEKKDGSVVQSILPHTNGSLEIIDLPENILQDDVYKWLTEQGKNKLNISICVFQTFLLKVDRQKYIWFLKIHHLVTDAVSQKIIYDLTHRYYKNIEKSEEFQRDDVPSISDYIVYENEQRSSTKNDTSKLYWKEKVSSIDPPPQLYGNSNKTNSNASTRISIDLGAKRSKKLNELARDPDLRSFTLHLTLLNIFSSVLLAYLYKISGQNNLTIGTTNQNRTTRKFKQTVGYFIQIFPLFSEISNDETFTSLIQKMSLETNTYLKYAKSGLITPEISRSYNVLINYITVIFSDFAGFQTKASWLPNGYIDSSHFFHCHITDFSDSGNFNLQFDLNNEVFSKEQRQVAPEHFLKTLDAFIGSKDTKLNQLDIITEDEKKKIEIWNDTTVLFDNTETLLSKFEVQVKKTPDTIALIFKEDSYTYRAFNKKANQVAHFLLRKGIKPNDIIAVSLERSFELLVYIYGILKAGAAYLPLETNATNERLQFIGEDAGFKLLFFNHTNIQPEDFQNVECLHVKQIENEVSNLNILKPDVTISRKNLAYVIYTSGSTGEPKGVKCIHQGICNRLSWMNQDYPITEDDTLLQKTPITFDVSLWEIFWPLRSGAKLVIEIPDGHKDPDQLIETICKRNVSVVHFVPSMLSAFTKNPEIEKCTSLDTIFCSGEALQRNTVEKTYKLLNSVDIHNLYGPTEASVDVTSWHCKRTELKEGIAIGYPVANTQIYIVDEHLNQVPIGTKGELCIGGVQVADGYLNRRKLTSERFVKDIFSEAKDAKMYKTGDVVRYRPDGAIEYLGRTDNQIKLRGIRIELGEIEKTIEKNFNVLQVVVIVDSNEILVAYYTGESVAEHEMKNSLLQVLPEYMVPSSFQNLLELPITKNGKVNRAALKTIKNASLVLGNNFVPPNGDIEELLAGIWKEVLGLEKVSTNANFISLGGHSLAAIRVTARINEEVEMKFSLNKIFEFPTIAQYAWYLEKTLMTLMDEDL